MERGSETVGDKLHCREGNNPDQQLRCLNNAEWKGCGITQTVRMLAEKQPPLKKCVIAYSSSDPAPKMIGDQALYRSSGLCRKAEW